MEISEQLFEQAFEVRLKAYAPYSRYKVGAAIYGDDMRIYTGCNVENVSFPCGSCAETGAIASMIAGGAKKIKAILVMSDGKDLVYPCGACLQRIGEFSDDKTIVYLADIKKIKKQYKVSDLLPHNFNAKELSHD